ncbi:DNA mismatch repair protein MutL [Schinkia azotoformans MEV2011]|uniref:DNA mismatch repair protein MutL n=1 Tax=Schinkia azotoformans MEV2011 TaxID=1348973 RepID=A0A072NRU5_SCHAZ|nr:DNA mismatch repair endonuclease MutL [Schinkia azotoformans]KEF39962.1 DNA mismatch repair protein MutL [Schinkia azotoformans MEV2011]MEC1697260.1 DNA mismatch repair endonuclease MutL [Schinkia azotoformans]MEC1714639.1 DNA mismatch repair endonuclease MutL [Schinkia azotoformans]MEC1724299.1 DNA mismatch repair endonuclease MutL [Schinkia azotoformans]MEC1742910.1 DNA mismatch repair endonuclease MutL [Schinkia azotoformans]
MGRIKQLDHQLSNKIAAGEVIERPASVVKELVENAIDAGSTRIEIHVKEAGLSEIRIIDNGDGIEPEDCLLAFERHATSKIKDENDLFRIRTLGFRGEALPSIASVSVLEMKSSTGEGPGTYIKLKGGHIEIHESTASRKGTEIIVSNLFFNTPARLKYMKTVHTELGNITDYLNRIALAHPEISLQLTHNGNRILFTSGNGDVLQVLASIYGMSIAKQMLPLKLESIDFEVKGYIARPEVTRASRNYISTIINGRFIKNYALAKAIQEGYHTLLPIGRYPIVLLNIEMDPLLVDVNVHPAKLEVRLSKEHELCDLITEGIKAAFRKQTLIPDVLKPKKEPKRPVSEQQTISFEHRFPDTLIMERPLQEVIETKANPFHEPAEEVEAEEEAFGHDEGSIDVDIKIPDQDSDFDLPSDFDFASLKPEIVEPERVPPLYPIGQMHGTYILAQNEKGLYLIDQHAAQERIKYEYFKEKVGQVEPEVQELLFPLTLEYSKNETFIIEEHLSLLKSVGIFLEPFGGGSYIIRSHPQWFPKGEEKEVIEEIIQQVLTKKKVSIHELREAAAIMMSCKGSIKANRHLRNDEIFALLETLRKTTDPFTCPHGRPIIIHFSTYEMEKMFKRVM